MLSEIDISLSATSPDLRHQSFSQSWWHERASESEGGGGDFKGRSDSACQSGTAETALCLHNNGEPLQQRPLSAEGYQGRFLSHCDPSEQIVFRSKFRLNILGRKKTHLRLI